MSVDYFFNTVMEEAQTFHPKNEGNESAGYYFASLLRMFPEFYETVFSSDREKLRRLAGKMAKYLVLIVASHSPDRLFWKSPEYKQAIDAFNKRTALEPIPLETSEENQESKDKITTMYAGPGRKDV